MRTAGAWSSPSVTAGPSTMPRRLPARSVVPPGRPGERRLEQRAHVPCRQLRLADGDRGPAEEVERAHVRAEGDAERLLRGLDRRELGEAEPGETITSTGGSCAAARRQSAMASSAR